MPFTPMHMGPGLVLKALGGRHVSVLAFGLVQVAIDLEPLFGLLRGRNVLHGWTHTLAGATAISLALAVVAAPLVGVMLRAWNALLQRERVGWLASPPLARGAVLAGSLLGGWSHVLLDGLMHADLHPFAPWSQAQPWLRLVDIDTLHLACVVAGALGVLAWWTMAASHRARGSGGENGDVR